MIKRIGLFFVIFSSFLPPAFSVPLESLVSQSHAALLRSSGETIIETQLKNPSPLLLPQNNSLRQYVANALSELNPNMLVEALYLYKKPASFHTTAAGWDSAQRTAVFNQMLALSTLTGIQYYSASRGAMRTLYDYSAVIDGPSAKKPLPDPVFNLPPAALTVYARQRDLTFGDNIYRYDYTAADGAVFFIQENATALNYGIIPAVGKGKLRSVMAVIDCGDSILIYAASMAKAANLPGMQTRVGNSFGNRAQAVLEWFTGRLDAELFAY